MTLRQTTQTTDSFVDDFKQTLTPSAIDNASFIDFEQIQTNLNEYQTVFERLESLHTGDKSRFIKELTDELIATDETRAFIDCSFELLGERGRKFVSADGVWAFYDIQRAIDKGDRSEAQRTATALEDIGLRHLLQTTTELEDHYRGMLVGMETHKRKNRQGTNFENRVQQAVNEAAGRIRENGHQITVEREYTTTYTDGSGQSKKVDYALLEQERLRVAVEANMYTTTGSKPSEVRRAYTRVNNRMAQDNVAFTWVTDGYAWQSGLEQVLRQAYDDIEDVYNLRMLETEWVDDVLNYW